MKTCRSLPALWQRLSSRNFFVMGILQGMLVFGLLFSNTMVASLTVPFFQHDLPTQQTQADAAQLDQAADKAEQASDKIFDGLDTTKQIIGKTDVRNRVIETGRDKASRKLESIAEKARSTKQSGDSLSPTEQRVVNQLQPDQ
ncbi:MAG TPA: hypothetical protein V6C65_29930 [Allocoleopsis sp.]